MKNPEIVRKLYDAFAVRDRDAILEIFDPKIVWIQNAGFPEEAHILVQKQSLKMFSGLFGLNGNLGRRSSRIGSMPVNRLSRLESTVESTKPPGSP